MGLFDLIAGEAASVLSNTAASGHPGMMEEVTQLINGSGAGGLPELVNTFREKGLGEVIASWISTGHNLPISAEQLQSVLGNERMQAIAQKLGLPPEDVAQALSTLLPQVIDKLTPNGHLPEGGLLEQGLSLLKGFGAKA